jgi:ABC-type sugar transport system substrate-binding protein
MLQALVEPDEVFPMGEKIRAVPYRVALVNGFVGNTWRIQMVKTAKAFAEQAGVKENIKEFKVVSTGTDVAAQLGAMEDFINQGFQAIVTIAVAPDGFDRIIRLADKNNVVVVPFDNILDTDKVMMVNEDQKEMGRMSAHWVMEQSGKTSGDILEVRGLPGNSVDRDRHLGFREVMEAAPNKFNITEVVGNWDTGTRDRDWDRNQLRHRIALQRRKIEAGYQHRHGLCHRQHSEGKEFIAVLHEDGGGKASRMCKVVEKIGD